MNAKSILIAAAVMVISASVLSDEADQQRNSLVEQRDELMDEEFRTTIRKIVVLPGVSPPSGSITGCYGKETDGFVDGYFEGQEIGVIRQDIGGIPVAFPIPELQLLGAIFGSMSGGVKRQIQDLRDALTEELADSAESNLTDDALATDVFWGLRDVSGLEPKVFALTTPIPEDTDAILYVSISNPSISVDVDVATITFTAAATLLRLSDGRHLYENEIHYQDKDTLRNWTANDTAAWDDYASYARHYVGREIVAELFERAEVKQSLLPKETQDVSRVKKQQWKSVSRSQTPTLAWDLELSDDEKQIGWAKQISEADISYELEIYDLHQLVYSAKQLPGQQHTVEVALEDCNTYRWSVRPAYRIDGGIRFGEWMRSNPDAANGNMGKASSVASAYIYDFASLKIECARR